MKFVELRYLTDEDFDNRVLRGLLYRKRDLDVVRVQDVGLSGAADPEILAYAVREVRVLLTHDVSTIPPCVEERMRAGERVAGVFEVPQGARIGTIIEDPLLLAECSFEDEWA